MELGEALGRRRHVGAEISGGPLDCVGEVGGLRRRRVDQQETVSLPPALTIGSLVLFGALFGPMGITLGTPLAAVGIVLVRMAYVEDVLERGYDRLL